MPRTYGGKLLIQLQQGDSTLLGVRLGRLCVEANLPVAYVAEALEVSRNTVNAWFRGQVMHEQKRKIVEAFMYLVEQDMKNGALPVLSLKQAKTYVEGMIGRKI
jgi:predicted XRE-type DNA-binding protein